MSDRPSKKRRIDAPALQSPHRLVVGVDFGTTYSGVSFVTTDKTELDDVYVVRSWPGKDGELKVPSRIAFATENTKSNINNDLWGYQIKPNMKSCAWFKLLLDADADQREFDDPELRSAVDNGCLRLPKNRSPQSVTADYLAKISKHLTAKLTKELGKDILDATPTDYWFTVPAVWSDKAQALTRSAAQQAGFALRPGDTIHMIPDPEAAAITVLMKMARSTAVKKIEVGETMLICDCGGGTVDITSYLVTEIEPDPTFEELCVSIGGKCGASSIDRNLLKLMSERFGTAWDQLDYRFKGPGSLFMNAWEISKRQLGTEDDDDVQELGPIELTGIANEQWYDDEEGMVRLTKSDIEKIFEPTVQEVLKLIAKQKSMIEREGKSLNHLALVGGFGDSEHLYSKIQQRCEMKGVNASCPQYPQAAIVRGSALRGLTGMAPGKRRCRRHYGLRVGMEFRAGVDPEKWSYIDRKTGRKMCSRRMDWIIDKGEDVTETTVRRCNVVVTQAKDDVRSSTVEFHCYNHDNPPDDGGQGILLPQIVIGRFE